MFGAGGVVYGRGVVNYNEFKFGNNKLDKDKFKEALSRYQNSSKNSAAQEEFVNAINNIKNSGSDIGKEFKELFKLSNSILSSMRGNSYWADRYEEIGSRLLLVKAAVKAGVERNNSVYFDRAVTNQQIKTKLSNNYKAEIVCYTPGAANTNMQNNEPRDKFSKKLITLYKAMSVCPNTKILHNARLLKLKDVFCEIYKVTPVDYNVGITNFQSDARTLLKLMPQDKNSILELYQDILTHNPPINRVYIPELLDVLRDGFLSDEISSRVAGFLHNATPEETISILTKFQRELKGSKEHGFIKDSFNQFVRYSDYKSAAKIAEIFGEELGEQAITDFLIKCSGISSSPMRQYSVSVPRILHHELIVEIMQRYVDILSLQNCTTIVTTFAANCGQTKANGNFWQCVLNVFKVLECARDNGKIDVNTVEESVSQLLQKCEPELENLVNYCIRSTEVDLDNIKRTFNVLKTVGHEIISLAQKDAALSTDSVIIANCESRKQSINELRRSLASYCINSGNKQAIDIGKAMNSAVPI